MGQALLIRFDPTLWTAWQQKLRPGHSSKTWFKIGRLKPNTLGPGIPVIVLATKGMGIRATGKTISEVSFQADPDVHEMTVSEQPAYRERANRIEVELSGVFVPLESLLSHAQLTHLYKRRDTMTWLSEGDHAELGRLIAVL